MPERKTDTFSSKSYECVAHGSCFKKREYFCVCIYSMNSISTARSDSPFHTEKLCVSVLSRCKHMALLKRDEIVHVFVCMHGFYCSPFDESYSVRANKRKKNEQTVTIKIATAVLSGDSAQKVRINIDIVDN